MAIAAHTNQDLGDMQLNGLDSSDRWFDPGLGLQLKMGGHSLQFDGDNTLHTRFNINSSGLVSTGAQKDQSAPAFEPAKAFNI